MKNGVNVAAISELVHEIRDYPDEGDACYRVAASWESGLRTDLAVRTMQFGTKRHARDYRFSTELPVDAHAVTRFPTPVEYALLGLSSCAMTVLVQGASYKGVTLSGMTINADASGDVADADGVQAGLRDITLAVGIDAGISGEACQELFDKVRGFSPNFVTCSEGTPVTLNVNAAAPRHTGVIGRSAGIPGAGIPGAGGQSGRRAARVRLSWRYAVQFDGETGSGLAGADDGGLCHSMPVDQPAVVAGLDEAPNPQEYLLGALAGDIIGQFVRLGIQGGIAIDVVDAELSGRIDMRGLLNVEGKIGIKVQDIVCTLHVAADRPLPELQELARRAAALSPVYGAIVNANDIMLKLG